MKRILFFLVLIFVASGAYSILRNNVKAPSNEGQILKDVKPSPIAKTGIYLVLSEENKSGQTGLASIFEKKNTVYVDVKLVMPAFTNELAGLYLGTCQKIGQLKFSLADVINGSSTTNLNLNIDKINQLLPMALVINRIEGNPSTVVACGEIKKYPPTTILVR